MKQPGNMVVMAHTSISGKISNCGVLEVHGYIDGIIQAERIIVRETGKLYGTIEAGEVEVHGETQGDIKVAHLIQIGRTGSVAGNVQYGQLAMEPGGDLSADLHNIPPVITGDLDVTVRRGQSVRITPVDLSALDPDDSATDLKFTVSKPTAGFIARSAALTVPLNTFTQSELQSGNVIFVHDGSAGHKASFDVVVVDSKGATSGRPHTVNVNVQ